MDSAAITGSQPFAEAAMRAVVETAAATLGFRGSPELVRLGERAVFRLPVGVVARVARPTGRAAAAKEVAVARWLRSEGMDVDEPLPVEQPRIATGLAVTFWRAIDGDWTIPEDLAGVLRELHRMGSPADPALGVLDPFAGLPSRVEAAALFTKYEEAWLTGRIASLRRRVAQLEFSLLPAVIHGDANIGNILKTAECRLVLLDLGGVCVGQPEWDLAITAVYRELGWHTVAHTGAM